MNDTSWILLFIVYTIVFIILVLSVAVTAFISHRRKDQATWASGWWQSVSTELVGAIVTTVVLGILFTVVQTDIERREEARRQVDNLVLQMNIGDNDTTIAVIRQLRLNEQLDPDDDTLEEKILINVDFTNAPLNGVSLRGATLNGANLTRADLTAANLIDTDLTGANLTDATMTDADLTGANLQDAIVTTGSLTGANLSSAILTGLNLNQADLRGTILENADLTNVTLVEAILENANLRGADLTGAILENADLRGADLNGAKLDEGALSNVRLDATTIMPDGNTYTGDSP